MSTPAPAFDARTLTEPIDKAEVRRWHKRLRDSGAFGKTSPVGVVILIIGAVILGFVMIIGFGGSMLALSSSGSGWGAILPIVIVAVVLVVVVLLTVQGRGKTRRRQYRLSRFAVANGMEYVPRMPDTPLPGMIFGRGNARASNDLVRGTQPRFVEFANYRYDTGSGKSRTTHRWGYVAIRLDSPLPHIVLDALGNNSFLGTNLPSRFDKDQRLSLEGDFNEHFALFCPEGYETDALYLFTPDIMARFIDNAAQLDVEIVDDWLFLYAKRDFATTDPATWAWLFSVVQALLEKLAQWGRWRDDRLRAAQRGVAPLAAGAGAGAPGTTPPVAAQSGALPISAPGGVHRPPPGVAVGGRRLKTTFSWVAIVIAVGIVLYLGIQGMIAGISLS